MSIANPLWGAPRIHGELLKLGIGVGETSVAKYMVKRREPPSQGWKTFLHNHADGIAAMDLFVVPTISFRLLYGLLIMGHGRRQILWFGVTAHPTAEWIANQVTEACGWEQAPRYLIRDRDGAYGEVFIRRLRSMGIRDRPTSPRSPWQNGYAERLIGSIRRECLDHVVVFSERHLRHMLLSYMNYHNEVRTHLSLEKDAPVSRAVEPAGRILCRPILGGLHHQYIRIGFTTGTGGQVSGAMRMRTGPTFTQGFFSATQGFQRGKSARVLAADRTRRKRLLHPILADHRKRPGQLQQETG
jgi:transposase InsO family protein